MPRPRREPRPEPAEADEPTTNRGERPDIIEGRNPVYEALKAGRPFNKILVAHGLGGHAAVDEILRLARESDVLVERVERQAIERLSPTGHNQGVLALAAAKGYVSIETILQGARDAGEVPLVVVLDGIEDPHNLGAVIRTAEAAGIHGVIIPERRAVGLTATVARTSAGAMEYVPVARVSNLSNALASLGKSQLWSVGISMEGTQDYTTIDFTQPTAIVIGAEGKGLSHLIKERCDVLASIPMRGHINSLNASVAAALVMYESMRQRRQLG